MSIDVVMIRLSAYAVPFIYLYAHRLQAYVPNFLRGKRVVVRQPSMILFFPFTWFVGLVVSQMGHSVHYVRYTAEFGYPETEEEMMRLSDAPNVTATWVLTGWVAIVIAFALRKKLLGIQS